MVAIIPLIETSPSAATRCPDGEGDPDHRRQPLGQEGGHHRGHDDERDRENRSHRAERSDRGNGNQRHEQVMQEGRSKAEGTRQAGIESGELQLLVEQTDESRVRRRERGQDPERLGAEIAAG
jgi:hypothetical protein